MEVITHKTILLLTSDFVSLEKYKKTVYDEDAALAAIHFNGTQHNEIIEWTMLNDLVRLKLLSMMVIGETL